MQELESEFLFRLELRLGDANSAISEFGERGLCPITSGTINGKDISGKVQPGGSDWFFTRADGLTEADIRLMLLTDDGESIAMFYSGILTGKDAVVSALMSGESLTPDVYSLRQAARFHTGSKKYSWLNQLIAIGIGEISVDPYGVNYDFYRIL
jgi:hypothetical protein